MTIHLTLHDFTRDARFWRDRPIGDYALLAYTSIFMDTFSQLQLINLALERIFPDGNDPYQIMTRLLEECGELAEQVHIFENSGIKRQKHGEPDPAQMIKEIQDVIGCALQVASHYGLVTALHEAIELRFQGYLKKGHITTQELDQAYRNRQ